MSEIRWWKSGLAGLVLASMLALAPTTAYPSQQGPIPGYHAEFVFSPALATGPPKEFVYDAGDGLDITATLYDASGSPLAFVAGSDPVRARLVFHKYDLATSTVDPSTLFSVDGTVGAPNNVATFRVDHASLNPGGAATAWVIQLLSPNLYGFKNNGLQVGHGGNCLHQSSGKGSGIGNGILCAESYYNEASATQFAAGDTVAAASLDGSGTPILSPAGGGGGPTIAAINILNGDLSAPLGTGPILYLASATDNLGAPMAINSASDVTWTVSAAGGGSFAQNLLSLGGTLGAYTVTATLIGNPAITDQVQLTLLPPVIASIDITNGDLSRAVGSPSFPYFATALDTLGAPSALDSAADIAWTISGAAGGAFAANVVTPGATVGVYTVTATLLSDSSVTDQVQLTLTAGGGGGPATSAAPVGGGGAGGGPEGGSGGNSGGGPIQRESDGPDPAPPEPQAPVQPEVIRDESPAAAPGRGISVLVLLAAALFVATGTVVSRGQMLLAPVRWVNIEEFLPPETHHAWIELLDAPADAPERRLALTRLVHEATGAVLWAWEGYVSTLRPIRFNVRYVTIAGVELVAAPASVETQIELAGITQALEVQADSQGSPIEVLVR